MRGIGERTAVILDLQPLWVDALRRLLAEVGINVVGTTASPVEALELIVTHEPALFVAEDDAIASWDDDLGLLRHAAAAKPDLCSIVLSTRDDPARIDEA